MARLRWTATILLGLLVPAWVQPVSAARGPAERCVATGISAQLFVRGTTFAGLDISPAGDRLLTTGTVGGSPQLAEFDLQSGRSRMIGVTLGTTAFGYLPDGSLLVGADEGGRERQHLFAWKEGGAKVDLTSGEQVSADFQGWSHDGAHFFVATNARSPQYFDIYEYDARTLNNRLLFKGGDYRISRPGFVNYAAISRDRARVAVEQAVSNIESRVVIRDLTSGTEAAIGQGPNVFSRPLTFSPDGRKLYYVSDAGSEFLRLYAYDLSSRSSRLLIEAKGDIHYALFSTSGRYLAVGVNRDGTTAIQIYKWPSWRRIAVSGLPQGTARTIRFSRNDRQLAFIVRTTTSPGDIYAVNLPGGTARRVAFAWPADFPVDSLVAGRVRKFRTFDGRQLSGVLYSPKCSSAGPRRGAVWVHGGPNGQAELEFEPLLQFLAANRYSVFAVNHRGSTGYGKSFVRLDDRRHATDDLKDILAAKNFLVRSGLADRGHVAVMGGSFGGFLTLATITAYPSQFQAAVDLFGIGNWQRVLGSTPKSWTSRRVALTTEIGDPDEDGGAYLRSISPLFKADRIKTPIIVIQGVNDPRVPRVESDELIAAVRKAGIPAEYLLLEGEGHNWPVRNDNEIRTLESIKRFLDEHLR